MAGHLNTGIQNKHFSDEIWKCNRNSNYNRCL